MSRTLYWNPELSQVWFTPLDSDSSDTLEIFSDKLAGIPGIEEVHIEPEAGPSQPGWRQIWPVPEEVRLRKSSVQKADGYYEPRVAQGLWDAGHIDQLLDYLEEFGNPVPRVGDTVIHVDEPDKILGTVFAIPGPGQAETTSFNPETGEIAIEVKVEPHPDAPEWVTGNILTYHSGVLERAPSNTTKSLNSEDFLRGETWSSSDFGETEYSVYNLVKWAEANKNIESVPIESIDEEFGREDISDEPDNSLEFAARAEATDLSYPILLVRDTDNRFIIANGRHRLWKAIQQGQKDIQAYVIEQDELEEAASYQTKKTYLREETDEDVLHLPPYSIDAPDVWAGEFRKHTEKQYSRRIRKSYNEVFDNAAREVLPKYVDSNQYSHIENMIGHNWEGDLRSMLSSVGIKNKEDQDDIIQDFYLKNVLSGKLWPTKDSGPMLARWSEFVYLTGMAARKRRAIQNRRESSRGGFEGYGYEGGTTEEGERESTDKPVGLSSKQRSEVILEYASRHSSMVPHEIRANLNSKLKLQGLDINITTDEVYQALADAGVHIDRRLSRRGKDKEQIVQSIVEQLGENYKLSDISLKLGSRNYIPTVQLREIVNKLVEEGKISAPQGSSRTTPEDRIIRAVSRRGGNYKISDLQRGVDDVKLPVSQLVPLVSRLVSEGKIPAPQARDTRGRKPKSSLPELTTTAKSFRTIDRIIEKKDGPHEFSSTQVELEGELAQKILQLGLQIPEETLAEDGREDNPHITVKYGLHTQDVEEVKDLLEGYGPIKVKLGKTSIFPAKEASSQRGGPEYDVVKIDVESEDLEQLNKLLCKNLEYTDIHPEYHPHITLAYVKSRLGEQFVGMDDVEGEEVEFNWLVFSDKEGNKTEIHLGNKLPNKSIRKSGSEDLYNPKVAEDMANKDDWGQLLDYLEDSGLPVFRVGQKVMALGSWPATVTAIPSVRLSEDMLAFYPQTGDISVDVKLDDSGTEGTYISGNLYPAKSAKKSFNMPCKPGERSDITGCIPKRKPKNDLPIAVDEHLEDVPDSLASAWQGIEEKIRKLVPEEVHKVATKYLKLQLDHYSEDLGLALAKNVIRAVGILGSAIGDSAGYALTEAAHELVGDRPKQDLPEESDPVIHSVHQAKCASVVVTIISMWYTNIGLPVPQVHSGQINMALEVAQRVKSEPITEEGRQENDEAADKSDREGDSGEPKEQ